MKRPLLCAALCAMTLFASAQQAQPTTSPDETAPLPDFAALIAKAKANSDKWHELEKSYTCKLTEVSDDIDSTGNKKGTHKDEFQVFFVNNVELHQHLSHDGKPLSESDAKKEQELIDKEIADIKANPGRKKGGGIVFRISDLLKMATIGPPSREMLNGRPTIRFDYSGNPSAKADGVAEELMKKLDGTIWLDEKDAAPAHITAHLRENYHIAGGLVANIKAGSHLELEMSHIHNEIWFTTHITVHGDGRILLFKGFDFNSDVTFSDYRKMKTTVTLEPGSQVIDENGNPIPETVENPKPPAQGTAPPKQ